MINCFGIYIYIYIYIYLSNFLFCAIRELFRSLSIELGG